MRELLGKLMNPESLARETPRMIAEWTKVALDLSDVKVRPRRPVPRSEVGGACPLEVAASEASRRRRNGNRTARRACAVSIASDPLAVNRTQ